MLLAIAVCPLWIPHWWETNRNKLVVACALGLPVAALYAARHPHALLDTAGEYVSFMLLLTALYVIAGGIRLTGDLRATPLVNAGFETPDGANSDIVGWNDVDFGNEGWRAGTFTVPANFTAAFDQAHPEGARVGYLNATSSISQNSQHALVAGDTSLATRAAGTGSGGRRSARCCASRINADRGLR